MVSNIYKIGRQKNINHISTIAVNVLCKIYPQVIKNKPSIGRQNSIKYIPDREPEYGIKHINDWLPQFVIKYFHD